MARIGTFFRWAATATGAAMTIAAQTKPEDALSNIGGWIKLAGLDRLSQYFASPTADEWATLLGLSLFIVSLGFLVVPRYIRRFKEKRDMPSMKDLRPPTLLRRMVPAVRIRGKSSNNKLNIIALDAPLALGIENGEGGSMDNNQFTVRHGKESQGVDINNLGKMTGNSFDIDGIRDGE